MNTSNRVNRNIALVTILTYSLVIPSTADAGLFFRVVRTLVRKPVIVNNVERRLVAGAKMCRWKGYNIMQRNSIIRKSVKNCSRMKNGLAPLGPDNLPIQLHHLRQKNNGWLIELTSKEHTGNTRALHGYTGKSEIERGSFNA